MTRKKNTKKKKRKNGHRPNPSLSMLSPAGWMLAILATGHLSFGWIAVQFMSTVTPV